MKIHFLVLQICLMSNIAFAQKVEKWLTKPDKSSLFEKQKESIVFQNTKSDIPSIFIDDTKKFQIMDGFGCTLTDGSATLINKLADKKDLLKELFGIRANNIGISYLRLSVGASDLSDHVYTYSETLAPLLKNFTLKQDEKDLIPVIKEILKINPKMKFLASPWTPPLWMKTNGSSVGGSLKKEYYPIYAKYLVKYVEEMAKHGITIDALTIQNEPLHPGNNPSLLMLASEQADFIKTNLGPEFKKKGIKTKIIIYDHNADRPDYPISILNDAVARKYIDGSAFHLYGGSVEAIGEVHDAHPDKNLYFTEQWIGHPSNFAGDFGWHIKTLIIGATKNWCKTVLEWNLAADAQMKPHTDGGCTACLGAITIDNGIVSRNAAYYILAHASKLVRPNSVRIASNQTMALANVAFKTPEGKIVLIVFNDSDKSSEFSVVNKGKRFMEKLEAGEAATYQW